MGAVCLLASGCAGTYHNASTSTLYFNQTEEVDGVEFSYKYDVLTERGSRRYARKERRKDIRIVAIQLTNKTDSSLKFSQDIRLYHGDERVYLVDKQVLGKELSQTPLFYFVHLLMSPWLIRERENGDLNTYPVGLILGTGFSFVNVSTAAVANHRFKQDLHMEDPIGKEIEPGETLTGLVGIRDSLYSPLRIRLVEAE